MKRKLAGLCTFYEFFSRIMMHLGTMRVPELAHWDLDLDHYLVLEGVATHRTRSEAEMVRLLGRNASFYSHAVNRLVQLGWLKKLPNKASEGVRFQVKITPKGQRVYTAIQDGFALRMDLVLSRLPLKTQKALLRQLANFNRVLEGEADGLGERVEKSPNEQCQMSLFRAEDKLSQQENVMEGRAPGRPPESITTSEQLSLTGCR